MIIFIFHYIINVQLWYNKYINKYRDEYIMNSLNFSTTKIDVDAEWEGNASAIEIGEAIVSALKDEVKNNTYYERYSVDQNHNLDSSHSQSLMVSSISKGRTEYEKYIKENPNEKVNLKSFIAQELSEKFDEQGWFESGAHDEAIEQFGGGYDDDLAEALVESLRELEEDGMIEDKDIILDCICQWDECGEEALAEIIRQEVVYAIEENDNSTIDDLFSHFGNITMVYTPIDSNVEESIVTCNHNTGSAKDIVPDEEFEGFLKMINLPAANYVNGIKEHQDFDLLSDDCPQKDQWIALLEKPVSEMGVNPKRKLSLGMNDVIEVIDNTTGYGTPAIVVNLDVDTLLSMDKDQSLLITDGAQIGIHDFNSGSGHFVDPTGPILVTANLDQWRCESGENTWGGYDINETYGFVNTAFDATTKLVVEQKSNQMEFTENRF